MSDAAEKSEKRAAIASQLKEGLLRLGPTFIKLGQLLSTRYNGWSPHFAGECVLNYLIADREVSFWRPLDSCGSKDVTHWPLQLGGG